ncbi:MAG: 2-C-methyl-D-erythritol 4-phosphate cytidylyltransferase [Ignavibacteria bacterium]
MKIKVIIPATGTGTRYGGKIPKQFLKIEGKEIIAHTIEKFHSIISIDEIIISSKKEYFDRIKKIIKRNNFFKVKKLTEGGKLRQDSVYSGLSDLKCSDEDLIIIHDAVRPFIGKKKITELIKTALKENCVILGLQVNETIKKVNSKNIIEKTVSREGLWSIQTPQIFRYGILKKSFEKAMNDKFVGTDESAIVEYSGYKVKVIEGERDNIKITVKADIEVKRQRSNVKLS